MTMTDQFLRTKMAYREIRDELCLQDQPVRAAENRPALREDHLPEGCLLLSLAEDSLPLGLNLYDPSPGPILVAGDARSDETKFAKALAWFIYDDEDALVRVGMSVYREQHTVSHLFGAPPGYVGYEEGGQLTEAVRRRPYRVVLFDEIEKAHPEVWNSQLQILDDGRLTDGQGNVVDFRNTVLIMPPTRAPNTSARAARSVSCSAPRTTRTATPTKRSRRPSRAPSGPSSSTGSTRSSCSPRSASKRWNRSSTFR
jgi:hypothetical protein